MPAIRTATTSSSDVPYSMLRTAVLMPGTLSVVMATTTDAVITSVLPVVHTSACWTAGIAAISVIMEATCAQTVFTARRPMVTLAVAEVYAPVQPVLPSTILAEEEAIAEEDHSVEAVASEADTAEEDRSAEAVVLEADTAVVVHSAVAVPLVEEEA